MVKLLINRVRGAGVFLLELLIVIAILVIVATTFFFAYQSSFNKSVDGKRKTDLYTIAQALEEYEKDNESYPSSLPQCNSSTAGTELEGYIAEVPCDPQNGQNYIYEVGPTQTIRTWFRIYASLKATGDPDIVELGCQGGCGPGNAFSYYVSSPNSPGLAIAGYIPSPPPTPTTGPTNTPTATPTPVGPTSTPTSAPTPTPTPIPNLLANPGFEGGSVSWNGFGPSASIVSTQFHSGTSSIEILAPGSGSIVVWQRVPALPDQSYTCSGWIKTSGLTATARLYISWRTSAGSLIGSTQCGSNVTGTVNWTQVSANLTSPANTAFADFRLLVTAGTGTAWYDDLLFY